MAQHVDVEALRTTSRVLDWGSWFIIAGVVFYSLMTTTPFVASHSEWKWSGPALGLMMDAAFIMALQADSVLARHRVTDKQLGPWPRRFRMFTGVGTIFLNVWASVEKSDPVGVAVHLLAPALLLIISEVAPVYRRAMADLIADAEAAAAELAAAEAAPDPDPERVPVPEDQDDIEPEAEVMELFPEPRAPRRRHAAPATGRANSKKARGLALMAEAAEAGNPLPTPEELAIALECSTRYGQMLHEAYREKTA